MQDIKEIRIKSFKILKIIAFTTINAFLISNLTALIIINMMKFDYYLIKKIKIRKGKQIQKELDNKRSPFPSAPGGLGARSPQNIKY